ncbi:hypothetical protein [Anaeromicropila herbilytica]|uniref:Uncharacterized protein n=1 Tax=Anaeromicropila herbilytica TaxID=2785025 RepID=A0A7R7EIC1_9FIRM|nr:hypothetical protein [Anaeromicropila herbilytica]BCN29396.1 hypothetical protein bsdtb5_06910 [Anaeromicropila herbilytica]
MNRSRYLDTILEENNKFKSSTSKRTLINVIVLIVVAVVAYFGIPSLDKRAAFVGNMLSGIMALMALIFFIKYLRLNSPIKEKEINKCLQEIQKNLKADETFDTFDQDISNPAFGEYIIDNSNIRVGKTFVLFYSIYTSGPLVRILRGDNLGEFDVHYFTQNGLGTDIGVDINDVNGKRIKTVMTSDKNKFYPFLNAMEQIKHYANGNDIVVEENSIGQEQAFVQEVREGIEHHDKKNYIKIGIFGIVFGMFLCIASSSSGIAFLYGGLALMVISIVGIIATCIFMRKK